MNETGTMRVIKVLVKAAVSFVLAGLFGWIMMYSLAWFGTQSYSLETPPDSHFYVAIPSVTPNAPFEVIRLEKLPTNHGSLFLPKGEDAIGPPAQKDKYRVLEKSDGQQIIELRHHDTDYDIWYGYKISEKGITPLYRRAMGPGQAVFGGLLGIVAVFLFWRLWDRVAQKRRAIKSSFAAATP